MLNAKNVNRGSILYFGVCLPETSVFYLYIQVSHIFDMLSVDELNVKLFKTTNGTPKVQHPCTKSAAPLHR